MDTKKVSSVVGRCTELIDNVECRGNIVQEEVEVPRGKLQKLLFGNTQLIWRCEKCNEIYPIKDPPGLILP